VTYITSGVIRNRDRYLWLDSILYIELVLVFRECRIMFEFLTLQGSQVILDDLILVFFKLFKVSLVSNKRAVKINIRPDLVEVSFPI
jgi:hypothetical protein